MEELVDVAQQKQMLVALTTPFTHHWIMEHMVDLEKIWVWMVYINKIIALVNYF